LWKMKLRLEAMMVPVTLWINALTRTGIKRLINRPRPKPLLVHVRRQSKGRSFPSGHVTSSIILWGWLFTIARSHREMNRVWRGILLSIALLFVALIGPSRIYLGDHWTTDVLGGYLYGGGWFGLSLCLYHELRKQGSSATEFLPAL
jgi:membrane-associated phospholipid phosphatase